MLRPCEAMGLTQHKDPPDAWATNTSQGHDFMFHSNCQKSQTLQEVKKDQDKSGLFTKQYGTVQFHYTTN